LAQGNWYASQFRRPRSTTHSFDCFATQPNNCTRQGRDIVIDPCDQSESPEQRGAMFPGLSVHAWTALRKWYEARDALLGLNFVQQDLARALSLARESDHEDALWLSSLFPGIVTVTKEEAKKVFLAQGEDPRALCFAARVFTYDAPLMRRSGELGYAAAQVWLSLWTSDPAEKWVWAERAFVKRDRSSIALMAEYLWHGVVCPKDERGALQLVHETAKMGLVLSQHYLGQRGYDERHPKRYKLWGKAAANGSGDVRDLISLAAVQHVAQWEAGVADCARVVVAIGRACRAHVNVETRCLFGAAMSVEEIAAASKSVSLYRAVSARARDAVILWLCFARRKRGLRDPGRIIAKMVWAERSVWSEAMRRGGDCQ
jgi:hypothetical protein